MTYICANSEDDIYFANANLRQDMKAMKDPTDLGCFTGYSQITVALIILMPHKKFTHITNYYYDYYNK